MRSLFLKIFLSFWAAQALFVILAIVITLATRPPSRQSGIEARQSEFLNNALEAYKAGGQDGIHNYLRSLHESEHIRLFLLDGQGADLAGRRPPEWIAKVARGEIRTADTF